LTFHAESTTESSEALVEKIEILVVNYTIFSITPMTILLPRRNLIHIIIHKFSTETNC